MKLITKKTEANFAHIKWASTHIRLISALINYKIDKENLIKGQEELTKTGKKTESTETYIQKNEKRISLEDLESNRYGLNSDLENITAIAKDIVLIFLYLVAYLPYGIAKYFLWNLIFKK